MKFCIDCSTELPENSIYCSQCGKKLPKTKKSNSSKVPISLEDSRPYLDGDVWEALSAAGITDLVLVEGQKIDFAKKLTKDQSDLFNAYLLGEEYARIWIAAGRPDIEKFSEGVREQKESKKAENLEKASVLLTEYEVKIEFDRAAFKYWKKIGRPGITRNNEGVAVYKIALDFWNTHNYQMDEYLFEVWLYAGQPDINEFDVLESLERYSAETQLMAQNFSNFVASSSSNSNAYSQGVLNSILNSSNGTMKSTCASCGMPIPGVGSKCPYCHGASNAGARIFGGK